jgi:hypothetical protein
MKTGEALDFADPPATLGAIRMRFLRERRRRGYRCYAIEVGPPDLDRLIARGLLDRRRRNDPAAVERALGGLLDRL